jgi:G3E family GTPase
MSANAFTSTVNIEPPTSFKKLPVTLLSGFLGAGKTTLLNHVLQSSHGLRIAVIVNDMSEVNIDTSILKAQEIIHTEQKIISFQNGCICCTLREDLLIEIEKLALSQQFDYLLIESTGISEPMPVAQTFSFTLPGGDTLDNIAYLDTLVTVVDGSDFLTQYRNAALLLEQEDDKTIADLLIEQVEFSNVILISKIDLIDESEYQELHAILSALNSTARILAMEKGIVPLEQILHTNTFSFVDVQMAPGWLAPMRGERISESEEYGISSFVWQARRPVHPRRFWNFIHADWVYGNLLRSKGFFWLASRKDSIGLWHQAGGIMRYEYAGKWWQYTPKSEWPQNTEALDWIKTKWHENLGDCRQEIVFIGQLLLQEKIISALNACLLTDTELTMDFTSCSINEDPFPTWE